MVRFGGIHTIQLSSGADQNAFEAFMFSEVFAIAAEVPGSCSRSGQSAIQSQHLIKLDRDSRTYLWLVQASGVFDIPLFTHIFHNMYGSVHERMNMFGSRTSSATFAVAGSFDAGPRFLSGKPVGESQRGDDA